MGGTPNPNGLGLQGLQGLMGGANNGNLFNSINQTAIGIARNGNGTGGEGSRHSRDRDARSPANCWFSSVVPDSVNVPDEKIWSQQHMESSTTPPIVLALQQTGSGSELWTRK